MPDGTTMGDQANRALTKRLVAFGWKVRLLSYPASPILDGSAQFAVSDSVRTPVNVIASNACCIVLHLHAHAQPPEPKTEFDVLPIVIETPDNAAKVSHIVHSK